MEKKATATSYTLYTETGSWLGQIVLTSDGMFVSVTDWGNLSYIWRSFGTDFREFILSLNVPYFSNKLATGMAYIAYSRAIDRRCDNFAERILPALQKAIRLELDTESRLNTADIVGKCANCGVEFHIHNL